jgi:hypothetical protein
MVSVTPCRKAAPIVVAAIAILTSGCDLGYGARRTVTVPPGFQMACVGAALSSMPSLRPVESDGNTFHFAGPVARCAILLPRGGDNRTLEFFCGRVNRAFEANECRRMDAFLVETYEVVRTHCPALPDASQSATIRCSHHE